MVLMPVNGIIPSIAFPKSLVTTLTRYSGKTPLYRILPTIAVLAAAIAADRPSRAKIAIEKRRNPPVGARGKKPTISSNTIMLIRLSQPPPAHTSCHARQESCAGFHIWYAQLLMGMRVVVCIVDAIAVFVAKW